MDTFLAGRPPIKIAGEWVARGKGPHDDVEKRVAYGLFHLPATAWFLERVAITGVNCIPRDDGWLVVVKGTRKGKKLVAFYHAPSFRDAVTLAVTSMDSGHSDWRVDTPSKAKR